MDASSSSANSEGNGLATGEEAAGSSRQSMDPPEEVFELPPRSSFSSFRKSNGNAPPRSGRNNGKAFMVHNGDDNRLDEFEMEGLIMTTNLGADNNICSRNCAPLADACSLAWNPRNRPRSAIGVLFFSFLCVIALKMNDAGGSLFNRSIKNSGRGHKDPLSKLTRDQRQSLLKRIYGSWTFYDGSAEDRPKEPYMTVANAGNPYLDLPEDKFPLESWQADAVYANHFLDAAINLVRRGQQAIFTTYHGYGLSDVRVVEDGDGETVDYEEENSDHRISQRLAMFHMEEVDLSSVKSAIALQSAAPSWQKKGGWTTERSFDGLERRLTHAMMTNSDFVVVFTGSWQSMGYGGNHAWQSMAGLFETFLKGLCEKLGVSLVVRAIGLPPLHDLSIEDYSELLDGGKSTLVHTLGWSSIYGSDVDMVVWDDYSAIDDEEESAHGLNEVSVQLFDLFSRQALLSGTTSLPFIWGGDFDVLRNLHEHADVDVGQLGNGLVGVQETTSEKTIYDLPRAAQYVNCPENMKDTCQKEEYQFSSKCWIDRSDVTPPTPQLDHIPIMPTAIGWRMQQLKGYTLAYTFLVATLDALNKWSEITISEGFPLADEYWHMGDYIENVQAKVKALSEDVAPHCFQLQEKMNLPKRLCRHRMKGRTEFTPRANPAETSIRSLLKPSQVPQTKQQLLYEGNDLKILINKIPIGEVDAVEISDLQGKRRLTQRLTRARNVTSIGRAENGDIYNNYNARSHRRTEAIKPGNGWQLLYGYGDGCDGSISSSSTCGRLSSSNCLMEGHQGSRAGIWGNETTGWLVLSGMSTENGFVALNLEIGGRETTARRTLQESLPDSFVFEYAIGGGITTLDKTQLLEKLQQSVPGMGLLVILDEDESSEAKDAAVAVRVKGCADELECQFAVTHVYWS